MARAVESFSKQCKKPLDRTCGKLGRSAAILHGNLLCKIDVTCIAGNLSIQFLSSHRMTTSYVCTDVNCISMLTATSPLHHDRALLNISTPSLHLFLARGFGTQPTTYNFFGWVSQPCSPVSHDVANPRQCLHSKIPTVIKFKISEDNDGFPPY